MHAPAPGHGVAVRFIAAASLLLTAVARIGSTADPADNLFRKGVEEYDSMLLKQAVVLAEDGRHSRQYLFTATCLWRIQVIKYVAGDKKGITLYGERALAALDSAERNDEDRYLVEARRAYVNQLMAGLGIKNGATFGPRIAKNLTVMKKIRPDGYHVRIIEAINLLEMPSFAGGNPRKAAKLLDELYREYPDSSAVMISLARAKAGIGQGHEAKKLLEKVLDENPKNLLAKKRLEEIQ